MSALFVKLGIAAALFIIVIVIWRRFTFRRAQHVELVQVRGRCSSAKEQATIFVMIATHDNANAAARAIHSAFDGAACPFRVFVGLHETADVPGSVFQDPAAMRDVVAQATPTMAMYADLAKSGRYGRSFSDQVRALRVPVTRSYGVHTARAMLMQKAYRGQTFVLTLSDAAELQQGWDELAIESLAKCRDPHALLVAPPATTSSSGRSATKDAWDVAAASFLVDSRRQATTSLVPRFPVLERWSKAGLPVVGSRAFGRHTAAEEPVPALFWSGDCSFGPARAYFAQHEHGVDPDVPPLPTPFDPTLACLTSGEDALVSARMWTSGWAFYSPGRALAAFQDGVRPAATADADRAATRGDDAKSQTAKLTHEAVRLLLGGGLKEGDAPRVLYVLGLGPLHTLHEWQAFVGVDLAKKAGSGRAAMGATPSPDATEVVAKYDSWASYNAERGVYA